MERSSFYHRVLIFVNGIRVKQGETLLVPASENVLYIFGNATFLTATM